MKKSRFFTEITDEEMLDVAICMCKDRFGKNPKKKSFNSIKKMVKKKYNCNNFDLDEEKFLLKNKILLYQKSNSDYIFSGIMTSIAMIVAIVIFAVGVGGFDEVFKINKNDVVQLAKGTLIKDLLIYKNTKGSLFDIRVILIFFICAIVATVIYLFKMRYTNQTKICYLNFYNLCLETLEEVEKSKEQENNKASEEVAVAAVEENINDNIKKISKDIEQIKQFLNIK